MGTIVIYHVHAPAIVSRTATIEIRNVSTINTVCLSNWLNAIKIIKNNANRTNPVTNPPPKLFKATKVSNMLLLASSAVVL